MSGQSASRFGAALVERISVLTPDWLRALFLGQPMARMLAFVPENAPPRRGEASVSILTGEATAAAPRKLQTVDAVVPPDLFLKRTITAPTRARTRLHQTALLDLRQRTPFGPTDVWWQLDRPVTRGTQMQVTQWVAKRSDVADWRKRMAQHGYRLRRLYVRGAVAEAPIADFAPQLAPWGRWIRWINGTLTGAAVLAVLVGWLYPVWVAERQTKVLTAQLQDLRAKAVGLRREVEELRGRDAARTAFLDTILRRPLLVNSLRELTVALPDDVWIASLGFAPERVVFNGETDGSAADLVLQLGNRPRMVNPRLSGPVQRTSTGAEKFEITVDLSGAG